jgi:hypothetical protein
MVAGAQAALHRGKRRHGVTGGLPPAEREVDDVHDAVVRDITTLTSISDPVGRAPVAHSTGVRLI